jgi:hypothetical protein
MREKYHIMVVEDEFHASVVYDLSTWGLLDLPADGFGPYANTDSVFAAWTRDSFNEEYARYREQIPEEDLVHLSVASAALLSGGDLTHSHPDVVLLDVDLNAFGHPFGGADNHFGGLDIFRQMGCELSDTGRFGRTLFILYTASPDVLKVLSALVVHSESDYNVLKRICSPLVVHYSSRVSVAERAAGDGTESQHGLLKSVLAAWTAEHSLHRLGADRAQVLATLGELRAEFDPAKWRDLRERRMDGWTFRNLFPLHCADVERASSDQIRRDKVGELHGAIARSFRRRLAEFILEARATRIGDSGWTLAHLDLVIAAGLRSEPLGAYVEAGLAQLNKHLELMIDIVELHERFGGELLAPLRAAARGRRLEEVMRLYERLRNEVVEFSIDGARAFWRIAKRGPSTWYLWKSDYDRIEAVISANASRCGVMLAPPEIEKVEKWIRLSWNAGGPMTDEDYVRAVRSAGDPYDVSRANKLPELRQIVCEYYDGFVEIVSVSGGETKRVPMDPNGVADVGFDPASTAAEQTTYAIWLPRVRA